MTYSYPPQHELLGVLRGAEDNTFCVMDSYGDKVFFSLQVKSGEHRLVVWQRLTSTAESETEMATGVHVDGGDLTAFLEWLQEQVANTPLT